MAKKRKSNDDGNENDGLNKNIVKWIIIISLIIICASVYYLFFSGKTDSGNNAQIANPASEYCLANGGVELEIRTAADGSQLGYCLFDGGKECEEWAYYRGECSK